MKSSRGAHIFPPLNNKTPAQSSASFSKGRFFILFDIIMQEPVW
jgi:hypothetical protein